MRKLGEQWIEVIDGEEHMVKAVDGFGCGGCVFFGYSDKCWHSEGGNECPVSDNDFIVLKDLGVLRDGRLQCPFCGEYPNIRSHGLVPNGYSVSHQCTEPYECHPMVRMVFTLDSKIFDTKQEAIDAWNRRA